MNVERWATIPEFPNYEASDRGRIRRSSTGRVLRQNSTKAGYRSVTPLRDGAVYTRLVHRLVATAFHGPIPAGLEVHHVDFDVTNNNLDNLKYVTHLENMHESIRTGRKRVRLNEDDVRAIRAARASGASMAALARQYQVTFNTIKYAINGRNWGHVR